MCSESGPAPHLLDAAARGIFAIGNRPGAIALTIQSVTPVTTARHQPLHYRLWKTSHTTCAERSGEVPPLTSRARAYGMG
jgi:hypothetical protein